MLCIPSSLALTNLSPPKRLPRENESGRREGGNSQNIACQRPLRRRELTNRNTPGWTITIHVPSTHLQTQTDFQFHKKKTSSTLSTFAGTLIGVVEMQIIYPYPLSFDSWFFTDFWFFTGDGVVVGVGSPGWGLLPYMGYIGMCGPKGYGFSAVLVINWVSILAILPPFWS